MNRTRDQSRGVIEETYTGLDGDTLSGAQRHSRAVKVCFCPHRCLTLAGADRGEAAVLLSSALDMREISKSACRKGLPREMSYLLEHEVLLALLHRGLGGDKPHIKLDSSSGAGKEGNEATKDYRELHFYKC